MFIKFIFILLILFSFGVSFLKPKMHSPFAIYSSDYNPTEIKSVEKIQTIEPFETNIIKEEKTINSQKNKVTPQKTAQYTNKSTSVNSKNINTQKNTAKKESLEKAKKNRQVQTAQNNVKPIEQKTEEKMYTTSQQIIEQEELIAWNKWHSNLQNSIMKDARLSDVPFGTIFRFSFIVDKYGRISDIKTWSDTPEYNIKAIQCIAPVIKSYQGKSILDFPQNSQRFSTQFVGKFKIVNSPQNKYSTSENFNDIEKIRK